MLTELLEELFSLDLQCAVITIHCPDACNINVFDNGRLRKKGATSGEVSQFVKFFNLLTSMLTGNLMVLQDLNFRMSGLNSLK